MGILLTMLFTRIGGAVPVGLPGRSVKRSLILLVPVMLLFALPIMAGAADDASGIPERVPAEHWSCRDLAELAVKYEAPERLPESAVGGTRTYTKEELARVLCSVLEKVCDKAEKEGPEAIPREDLEKMARLHGDLQENLDSLEAYRTRREAIKRSLPGPRSRPSRSRRA